MRTPEQIKKLSKYIDNPSYEGLSVFQIVQKLNATSEATYGDVDNQDVLRELPAMSNPLYSNAFVWDVVKTASAYSGQDTNSLLAKDVANRLIFTFESKLPINMGGASFETLSSAAIQAGFFTQEQLAILKNLGKTLKTPGETLNMGRITPDDVEKARKT